MSKVPECDLCLFYSKNAHIICAVHPFGVDGNYCLDFRRDPKIEVEDEELWSPEGYSYYAGQLIKNPTRRLTPQQQLNIIDTHPFFTGRCPECGYEFPKDNPPAVHWDCPACGFIDDAIH